jgi:dCTP deaminase
MFRIVTTTSASRIRTRKRGQAWALSVRRGARQRMILSDRDILTEIEAGRIRIEPPIDLEKHMGSCSIDFRLGNTFMVFEHSRYSYIDPLQPQSIAEGMRTIIVPDGEPFIMQAGDFALASTVESLELPDDLLGRLEGRSSIARLGITVHSTAAVFEPGWIGTATMELSNLGRMAVALYPGMRICSFTFQKMSSPVRVPYRAKSGNKYAGQVEPRASRLSEEDNVLAQSNGRLAD